MANYVMCPYCGSAAVRRSAAELRDATAWRPDAILYVCMRYPECDAYVGTHQKSGRPLGTLANKPLRRKRIAAHAVFDKLWQHGHMSRDDAYRWMQSALDLPEAKAHIGKLSEWRCNQLIAKCRTYLQELQQESSAA